MPYSRWQLEFEFTISRPLNMLTSFLNDYSTTAQYQMTHYANELELSMWRSQMNPKLYSEPYTVY